jgi:hypothetical protein
MSQKERVKRWLSLGIKVGGVMSVLSWFGNLRRYNPHGGVGISAFPDLLTLLALPVLVFLVMRSVVRDGTASTRKSVRRTAMMAVLVSAVLYAVSDVLLGAVAFSRFFSQSSEIRGVVRTGDTI